MNRNRLLCSTLARVALRLLVASVAVASAAGCATQPATVPGSTGPDGPLIGRIVDTRTGRPISREELLRRASAARFVILGEAHDNADHHRLQAEVLQALVRGGRAPALAMEQFDREHQPALDAARAAGEKGAERIAEAARFDRKGWRWPDYKPLIDIALAYGLPIRAANLSREDARRLMKSGAPAPGLAPADSSVLSALEQDIINGHCGIRPPAPMLSGMVEAQRARDAQMAQVLAQARKDGAVLIAGAGHARRNRGVPHYLAPPLADELLSLGFVEVNEQAAEPVESYAGVFDVVWFTRKAEREDPCRNFRLPKAAPANA